MQQSSQTIQQHLNRAEGLATGSRRARFFYRPAAYLLALGFRAICYPFVRRAWRVSCRIITGDRVQVSLPAATDLFLLGCKSHPSELRLARFLLQFLEPNNTVLDVGAHMGYFSLVAASRVGSAGKVLAIEPAPEAFALLQHNAHCNAAITCLQVLLDRQDGERIFYRFPPRYEEFNTTDPTQYAGEAWLQRNPPQSSSCTARSGDSLLQELQLVPRLVKLDVEGHEADVLLGLQQTIEQHHPAVVLEFAAPGTGAAQRHQQADAWLQQRGYRPYALNSHGVPQAIAQPVAAHVAATGWRSDNIVYLR